MDLDLLDRAYRRRAEVPEEPLLNSPPERFEDILYWGAEDDDTKARQVRDIRYEKAAQRYLGRQSVRLLSASLRGPFDAASGWNNPWLNQNRPSKRTQTVREPHNKAVPQKTLMSADVADQESRLVRHHLPSPDSLLEASMVVHVPATEDETHSRVQAWAHDVGSVVLAKDDFWAPDQMMSDAHESAEDSRSRKRKASADWLKTRIGKRRRIGEPSPSARATSTPKETTKTTASPTRQSSVIPRLRQNASNLALRPVKSSLEMTTPSTSEDKRTASSIKRRAMRRNFTEDDAASSEDELSRDDSTPTSSARRRLSITVERSTPRHSMMQQAFGQVTGTPSPVIGSPHASMRVDLTGTNPTESPPKAFPDPNFEVSSELSSVRSSRYASVGVDFEASFRHGTSRNLPEDASSDLSSVRSSECPPTPLRWRQPRLRAPRRSTRLNIVTPIAEEEWDELANEEEEEEHVDVDGAGDDEDEPSDNEPATTNSDVHTDRSSRYEARLAKRRALEQSEPGMTSLVQSSPTTGTKVAQTRKPARKPGYRRTHDPQEPNLVATMLQSSKTAAESPGESGTSARNAHGMETGEPDRIAHGFNVDQHHTEEPETQEWQHDIPEPDETVGMDINDGSTEVIASKRDHDEISGSRIAEMTLSAQAAPTHPDRGTMMAERDGEGSEACGPQLKYLAQETTPFSATIHDAVDVDAQINADMSEVSRQAGEVEDVVDETFSIATASMSDSATEHCDVSQGKGSRIEPSTGMLSSGEAQVPRGIANVDVAGEAEAGAVCSDLDVQFVVLRSIESDDSYMKDEPIADKTRTLSNNIETHAIPTPESQGPSVTPSQQSPWRATTIILPLPEPRLVPEAVISPPEPNEPASTMTDSQVQRNPWTTVSDEAMADMVTCDGQDHAELCAKLDGPACGSEDKLSAQAKFPAMETRQPTPGESFSIRAFANFNTPSPLRRQRQVKALHFSTGSLRGILKPSTSYKVNAWRSSPHQGGRRVTFAPSPGNQSDVSPPTAAVPGRAASPPPEGMMEIDGEDTEESFRGHFDLMRQRVSREGSSDHPRAAGGVRVSSSPPSSPRRGSTSQEISAIARAAKQVDIGQAGTTMMSAKQLDETTTKANRGMNQERSDDGATKTGWTTLEGLNDENQYSDDVADVMQNLDDFLNPKWDEEITESGRDGSKSSAITPRAASPNIWDII